MIYQTTPRVQMHKFTNIADLVKDIDDVFISEIKDIEWGTLNIIAKTDVIKQIYSLITKKNNIVSVNGKYTIFEEDTNEKVSEIFDKYDILHIAISECGEVFIETLDYYELFNEVVDALDYYELFNEAVDGCIKAFAFIQQGIDVKYMAQAEKYNVPVLWFDV